MTRPTERKKGSCPLSRRKNLDRRKKGGREEKGLFAGKWMEKCTFSNSCQIAAQHRAENNSGVPRRPSALIEIDS